MKDNKIVAVIVTYNRKALLLECLDAVLSQSYSVNTIILIDNASTDGTFEELENNGYINNGKIQYIKMEKNMGGAGGFYEGLKLANKQEFDWIWIMDDDTIPTSSCLENLLKGQRKINKEKISFLASAIYGANGEFMNLPSISNKKASNGYAYWYEYLKDGMVNISDATFVSILVNSDAVKKCGLPCKDYFIWGDDTEYTTRLTKNFGDAFFVGDSIAIHKRANAKNLSIDDEDDPKRMKMYAFLYRNKLINQQYYENISPWRELILSILRMLKNIGNRKAFNRRWIMVKGTWEGTIHYKRFKSYIDSQLNGVRNTESWRKDTND